MPTTISVFIDTNVFVATRDENDSTHKRAKEISESFNGQDARFYTSSDVVGETLTVLSKKLGKEVCNDWYKDFQESGIIEIFIDEVIHNEARDSFKKVKSKNISFIDCSSIVAMKKNKIETIFSFDKDFKKMGVKLLSDIV